ncbi:adenosylcobinamide-phosphate synthase CbiB [Tropicimonas sp. TH_r6]|uniref:adenosylcobinamide-phosphate synthase CbiB n=1 Tax=Tropicimonas sp. TH_r6 TaxID=3082085 RepID=UPI00295343DE|nr:adenosylcobinamide-phosphate synthase CbiB [Tropicimonas sp. TH_r6]MDV7143312.1 adenosylcobinamide-phosphate synthase CbiB [Tropicimonas sp. TH_r6]
MTGAPEILLLALLLDAALGEPAWLWARLPHPAVLMGWLIGWADTRFNRGAHKRRAGIAVLCALVLGAGLLGWLLEVLLPWRMAELLLVAILVAHKSLVQHVAAVAAGLRESLAAGRRAVAMIVGRDTAEMDEPAVVRSGIESAAENLSDGVTAPVFWYLLGGLPGILIYKVTNTADSMIGYRTERHAEFGWASARFDDLLNWIPARVTALLILLTHGRFADWGAVSREARLHRSPNAGWPEAAMARCLGVALSGPRSYEGELRDYPFVHPEGNRTPGPEAIDQATAALWRSWAGICAVAAVLALLT